MVRLTIWYQLFLEFWLIGTCFFAHPLDQRAVTRLENVRQLNIRRGKKLDFQLSHRQSPMYCLFNYIKLRISHIIFVSQFSWFLILTRKEKPWELNALRFRKSKCCAKISRNLLKDVLLYFLSKNNMVYSYLLQSSVDWDILQCSGLSKLESFRRKQEKKYLIPATFSSFKVWSESFKLS